MGAKKTSLNLSVFNPLCFKAQVKVEVIFSVSWIYLLFILALSAQQGSMISSSTSQYSRLFLYGDNVFRDV
jgi:hypothetical protein